ncbi:MAG: efflux RND transporter permease subunit [Candidatus Margulisiibacteriota bacterium]
MSSLANTAIKRPIFITCIVVLMLALGYLSLKKLPVDLFPDVTFPVVTITTPYPGAGPSEVETLISKVLEEEISTLPGIKRVTSTSAEGVSVVVAEFTLKTDVKYAEQQIRDRVSSARSKLPHDTEESTIRRIDPADQPILILAIKSNLPPAQLFDLTNLRIKPKIEQVNQVGLVSIIGGRKREIHVDLDPAKLKAHEVSASKVSSAIADSGMNVPAGKVDQGTSETVLRTLGEYNSLSDIGKTVVNFMGNDVAVKVQDLGTVKEDLEDEKNRAFVDGQKTLFLQVYRQSGSNTIEVVNAVIKRVNQLNKELEAESGSPQVVVVRDGAKMIRANVDDVKESIIIGIALTILVVYLFLGSGRSTIITALALPNSLLGAFMLMAFAGFSINVMSLLALSLSVGLLVDDAIVVRENIFRHIEMGKSGKLAALEGSKEVMLAVIATTLSVIAVFGPIAFLQGMVGQFFKEFGMTICFAMIISLFDALTIAPMLSAYFANKHEDKTTGLWNNSVGLIVRGFGKVQDGLEALYGRVLKFTLRFPLLIIFLAIVIFVGSIQIVKKVPKTFLPAQDFGEFMVSLETPPGTSLDGMAVVAKRVDALVRQNKEVQTSIMTIGSAEGAPNVTNIYVSLVDSKHRKMNTSDFKALLRDQLKPFADAKPIVKDYDAVGGGQRPFTLNIVGSDLHQLEAIGTQVFARLKNHPALLDPEFSFKAGKPEFQVVLEGRKADQLGISSTALGSELRTQVEGSVPAVFRINGEEYDIRVRLQPDKRDLEARFDEVYVPNINRSLVRLSSVARPYRTTGPTNITRQDRARYVQIAADITPNGPGIGGAMKDIDEMFKNDIKLPEGVRYSFVGQAENFQELGQNMMIAACLGILFIYLVLASLYESFVTPFTIMLVLPLAACGAFYGLFVGGKSLDIFSMIGCIMLLGIASKNSILLVDYTNQLVQKGLSHHDAVIEAGKTRLRPILMTTLSLIAGMMPIAIGLNEASRQRTSMGVAIIGGLISSTLLTLVVVPAAYSFIERFRVWSLGKMKRLFGVED